jgi:hypothetical protein
MKDVVVSGVAQIGATVARFLAATNDYDGHIPHPACLNHPR